MIALPAGLTPADILAVALHLVAWGMIGHAVEHPPAGRPSVSVLMEEHRRAWMRQFTVRDARIFDGTILGILQQSTSFFASACMLAIGGGLALIGNPELVARVAQDVALGPVPLVIWRLKILLALILVINALLKFLWAHRLFGYCAVLMASVPDTPQGIASMPLAMKAAEINISAARNFNAGLRSVYFAISGLAWLAGPAALTLATVVVLWMTWRREFASASRRAILVQRDGKNSGGG